MSNKTTQRKLNPWNIAKTIYEYNKNNKQPNWQEIAEQYPNENDQDIQETINQLYTYGALEITWNNELEKTYKINTDSKHYLETRSQLKEEKWEKEKP